MPVRILFAAVAAFPIVFMLVSSLKPDPQIFGDMSSVAAFLPVGNISFDNYAAVFDRVPAARFLINSIGISAVTVVLGIFINSLCAFALSRMEVRGKRVVFTVILATLIVPFQTLALPLVWWVNQLPYFELNGFSLEISKGWLDTYQVQIIPFIANAFSIYLYHQYFESIPKELDEAARIDGAGWFKIYRQVVMPLAGPGHRHRRDPDVPAGLELLPVAAHGGPVRGAPPGHDRHPVLLPAQRLLGRSDGVRLPHHGSRGGPLHRLPALVHQQHRLQRRQGLTTRRPFPPRESRQHIP